MTEKTFVEQHEFMIDAYAKQLKAALDTNDMDALKTLAQTMVSKAEIWPRDRAISFNLSAAESQKFVEWREAVNKRAAEKQLEASAKRGADALSETKRLQKMSRGPYTGAIGGSVTFSFTPTTIGTVAKVKESITGEELVLTDFSDW